MDHPANIGSGDSSAIDFNESLAGTEILQLVGVLVWNCLNLPKRHYVQYYFFKVLATPHLYPITVEPGRVPGRTGITTPCFGTRDLYRALH